MDNIWLPANADLSTVEVLFADAGDMMFLKNLPQCPKLQIVVIFVQTDMAVFPAFKLPSLHLLGWPSKGGHLSFLPLAPLKIRNGLTSSSNSRFSPKNLLV
jgi:hypothetical protein